MWILAREVSMSFCGPPQILPRSCPAFSRPKCVSIRNTRVNRERRAYDQIWLKFIKDNWAVGLVYWGVERSNQTQEELCQQFHLLYWEIHSSTALETLLNSPTLCSIQIAWSHKTLSLARKTDKRVVSAGNNHEVQGGEWPNEVMIKSWMRWRRSVLPTAKMAQV